MSSKKLVVNELLSFLDKQLDCMDEVSVIQICTSNCNEEEIRSVKVLLYESLVMSDRMPSRRRDEKGERRLQDMIRLYKVADPDEWPVSFVCKDLNRLPPGTNDHVDVTRLLKDINTLKSSLADLQLKFEASQSTIFDLRADKVELKSNKSVNIPTVKLNNGLDMPVLGLGTWVGVDEENHFLYTDLPKLVEAMEYAIDIGYRYLDTAHLYRVEPEIGQVLNKKIKEGVVKREDMFINTKIWQHHHREADAIQAVRDSLRRLDLDYVDQVLIHWPMSFNPDGVDEKIDYLETWRGLEKVYEMGLAKSIGVSNFNVDQLKRLLANCKVPPAVNQVEINLNLGQKELVDFCKLQKIQVVAFSPFGTMMPFRQLPGSPEPKLNNPTMLAIAKKHGKTVTQVTLRYLYQRNIISIPKSITKARLLENASIFDFNLDEDDVKTIANFDVNYRTVVPAFWQDLEKYPFPEERLSQKEDAPVCYRIWKSGAKADID